MKCSLCREKIGKRACKVTLAQLICPSCCASLRNADCAGCRHYEASLSYQRQKQARRRTFVTEIIPEVEDLCDEALALVENGHLAQGRSILEGLRLSYPNYHMVIYGIGVCHGLEGQTDEAISCLAQAVEIFPAFAHAHYNLGSAYLRNGDFENAVKAYEAAIEFDCRDGSIGLLARERLAELEAMVNKDGVNLSTYIDNRRLFDRAFAAMRARRYHVAIELFEKVLTMQNNHVQSCGNLGLAHACLGNKQKALACLNRAIELDPEYEPAILNRLIVEGMTDGEALPGIAGRELSYYAEYKLQGKSYIQEVADELLDGKMPPD